MKGYTPTVATAEFKKTMNSVKALLKQLPTPKSDDAADPPVRNKFDRKSKDDDSSSE